MFEGDFADMCTTNLCSFQWGAEQSVKLAQTRELGPPSARGEISKLFLNIRSLGPSWNFSLAEIWQVSACKIGHGVAI